MRAALTDPFPPEPSPEALATSQVLCERIRHRIARAGGWIGFDRYMEWVLNEPGLGYYSAGSTKFGPAGDFVTAPELGSFLARTIARQFGEMLGSLTTPEILEIGAGNGTLAAQLLDELAELGGGEVRYLILEPSADLRERQRDVLGRFGTRVDWLERFPDRPVEGLILANEVVDALPAVRFVKRGGAALPLGVRCGTDGFEWAEGGEDASLSEAVASLEAALGERLPDGYRSEVCLVLHAWIDGLAATLARGAVLLVDYGAARREYYHPERSDGTLICHYRHRAHDDPFHLPGLQDVSAWVDFSACADAARAAGLSVAGFTTQGLYLAESMAGAADPVALDAKTARAFRTFVLPGEMGERFKLLLLAKGIEPPGLPGRDLRAWL